MTLTPFLKKISSLILILLFLASLPAGMTGCAGPRILKRGELEEGRAGFEGEDYVITYPLKRGRKSLGYLKLTLDLDLFKRERKQVGEIFLTRLTRQAHFLAEVLDLRIEGLKKGELEVLIHNLRSSIPECKIRIVDSSYKVVAATEKKEVGKNLYGRKAFPKRPENIFERAPDFLSETEERRGKRVFILTHFLNDAQDRPLGFLEITLPLRDYSATLEKEKKRLTSQLKGFAWTLARSLNFSLTPLDFRSQLFKIQEIFESLGWEMEGVKELDLINRDLEIIASTNVSRIGEKLPFIHVSSQVLEKELPERRIQRTALPLPGSFQRELKLKARVFFRAVNDTCQISHQIRKLLEVKRLKKEISQTETAGFPLLEKTLNEIRENANSIKEEIGLERLIKSWGKYPAIAEIELISPDLTIILSTDPARIGNILKEEASLGAYLEDERLVSYFPLLENGEPLAFIKIGLSLEEYRFVPAEEKENLLNYLKLSASLLNSILSFNISNRMKIEGVLDLGAMAKELEEKTGNSLRITLKEKRIIVSSKEPEEEEALPREDFELLYLDDYLKEKRERERETKEKELASAALRHLLEYSLAQKEKIKEYLEIERLIEGIGKVRGVEKMRLLDSSYRVIASSLKNETGRKVGRGNYSRRWAEEEVKVNLEEFANLKLKFLTIASPLKEEEALRGVIELTLTYPFEK
jgi:hypothetical protein